MSNTNVHISNVSKISTEKADNVSKFHSTSRSTIQNSTWNQWYVEIFTQDWLVEIILKIKWMMFLNLTHNRQFPKIDDVSKFRNRCVVEITTQIVILLKFNLKSMCYRYFPQNRLCVEISHAKVHVSKFNSQLSMYRNVLQHRWCVKISLGMCFWDFTRNRWCFEILLDSMSIGISLKIDGVSKFSSKSIMW